MQKTFADYLFGVQGVFESLIAHPDIAARLREDARTGGGYFCLADADGMPLLVCKIGEPSYAKIDKYIEFSQEKARRLANHPEHQLSRSSRNPDANQWGGAVRGANHIFSFSGLPEHLDELLSFSVAVDMNELGYSDLLMGNQFAGIFHEAWALRHPKAGTRT